jgi:hypothetical protein
MRLAAARADRLFRIKTDALQRELNDPAAGHTLILMDWVCKPDACDDCKGIAAGSPYAHLPTWPGMGATRCGKNCECEVRANEESWNDSLNQ